MTGTDARADARALPRRVGPVEFPAFSLDDISFDDAPLEEKAPPPASPPPPPTAAGEPVASATAAEPGVPGPLSSSATTSGIAYITVADASGRVLFRRAATADEVDEALRAADEAEREGQAAMDRISSERFYEQALEDKTPT